jgi:hypothetical protein
MLALLGIVLLLVIIGAVVKLGSRAKPTGGNGDKPGRGNPLRRRPALVP